jgi:hypothetical protein
VAVVSNFNPSRVAAGKSDGGQFAAKVNGEQELDLVDEFDDDIDSMEFGDGVYGDYPRNYDTVMELESGYMADIEANPTMEGMKLLSQSTAGSHPVRVGDRDWSGRPEELP